MKSKSNRLSRGFLSQLQQGVTRRTFLKGSAATAGVLSLPTIITNGLYGADASPGKRIQVAQIGLGRMGTGDMGSVMKLPQARVMAVCDLDSKRLEAGKAAVEKFYSKDESKVDVKTYADYHELLARPDIDAVVVSVPDHWHAQVAIEAVLAGKDVYLQKPMTYSIAEAQALCKAVKAKGRILQVGSQQRSQMSFRRATELVRNGAIGKIKTVQIGLGKDKPSGKKPAPEPVPANLNYDVWQGAVAEQPYMEGRVHPQKGIGRPGWITTECYGLGMITNWGAHHIDIAQWGIGMELGGPVTIESQAEFMTDDVWTVHTGYHIELTYSNGVKLILDDKNEVGIKFEGEEGWVFCTRGAEKVTDSDPNLPAAKKAPLRASDKKILDFKVPEGGKVWMPSTNHYLNWLEGVAAHKETIAPVEQGAKSVTTCALSWIGMKLKRKLTWDPAKEEFVGDDEANAMRSRKPRAAAYDIDAILKKANIS